MTRQVSARFVVDHPVRPGMVRAILDTLSAQGGAYVPQLVRRAAGGPLHRITWARPSGLLEEVAEAGTQTTFLRVAEGQPDPVLSFRISRSPRTQPSVVSMTIPESTLSSTQEIERVLGVCKGLYLFLESPWGAVHGTGGPGDDVKTGPRFMRWANFFGPTVVSHAGPARFLTSMAFIVEILPDGGIMLVTHATPVSAETAEGRARRLEIEESTGLADALRTVRADIRPAVDDATTAAGIRIRRRPVGPPG
jgi:hypothetical protein